MCNDGGNEDTSISIGINGSVLKKIFGYFPNSSFALSTASEEFCAYPSAPMEFA